MDRRTFMGAAAGAALPPTPASVDLDDDAEPLTVAIYVTRSLAKLVDRSHIHDRVKPANAVAWQLRWSTELIEGVVQDEPVLFSEGSARSNWSKWRRERPDDDCDAALLLTRSIPGNEEAGRGGEDHAVAEATPLIYTDTFDIDRVGMGPFINTQAVALHEIGHAFGLEHEHYETVYADDERRVVTLMGVDDSSGSKTDYALWFGKQAQKRLARQL